MVTTDLADLVDSSAAQTTNLADLADPIAMIAPNLIDLAEAHQVRKSVRGDFYLDQKKATQKYSSYESESQSQELELTNQSANIDLKVASADQNRVESQSMAFCDGQINQMQNRLWDSNQEEVIVSQPIITQPAGLVVTTTDEPMADSLVGDSYGLSFAADCSQLLDISTSLESENMADYLSDASKMALVTIWCGANLSVLMSTQAIRAEDQPITTFSDLTINLSLAGTRESLSWREKIELRKMEIELSFRKSFQDVLRRASRYPSCFGGLDSYEQLSQVVAGLESSLSDHNADSYLHKLMKQGQIALQDAQVMINDLQNARQQLYRLTQLLKVTVNQERQINGEEMKKKVDNLLLEMKEEAVGQITKRFVAESQRLVKKWSESLFSCYDLSLLPANNALIESRFNDLRRGERRVSGRKKTSALRRYAHFQILLSASSIEELCDLFSTVSFSTYKLAFKSLDEAEEKERVRYRLRRWPYKTAQALAAEYETLCQINLDDDSSTS